MSKKTFFQINWKEIAILLLIDFSILGVFVYFYDTSCMNALYECKMGAACFHPTVLSCTFEFFRDLRNLVSLYLIFAAVNFALSLFWHFVVRR